MASKIKTITPGAVYEPGEDSPVVVPASGDVFCLHISKPGATDVLPDGLQFGRWIKPGYFREIV
jgi:hypothetical protein